MPDNGRSTPRPPPIATLVIGALAVLGALALARWLLARLFGLIVLALVVALVVALMRIGRGRS